MIRVSNQKNTFVGQFCEQVPLILKSYYQKRKRCLIIDFIAFLEDLYSNKLDQKMRFSKEKQSLL